LTNQHYFFVIIIGDMEKWVIIIGLGATLLKSFSVFYLEVDNRAAQVCKTRGYRGDDLVLLDDLTDERVLQRGAVDSNAWNCYFEDSYFDMRTAFISAAEDLDLEVHSYPLPNHPELTTDAVVLEGGSNNNNIVFHVSGTHGPEGFVGSATQRAFLHQVALCRENSTCAAVARDSWPTVVLVHAANAYGFAHNRRFTEENVDLNRNFLTPEEFAEVTTRDHNLAGYVDFDALINPTQPHVMAVPEEPEALGLAAFYLNEAVGFIKAGLAGACVSACRSAAARLFVFLLA
jgi:hypothetical protein